MELTTIEERKKELEKLQLEAFEVLGEIIELSPLATVRVNERSISLHLKETDPVRLKKGTNEMFASEVTISNKDDFFEQGHSINFGSSGSFDPSETASYWRTIHAANILQNWAAVCKWVRTYCGAYTRLMIEIKKQNS